MSARSDRLGVMYESATPYDGAALCFALDESSLTMVSPGANLNVGAGSSFEGGLTVLLRELRTALPGAVASAGLRGPPLASRNPWWPVPYLSAEAVGSAERLTLLKLFHSGGPNTVP